MGLTSVHSGLRRWHTVQHLLINKCWTVCHDMSNVEICHSTRWTLLNENWDQGPVSRKSRKRFGPEKPFKKLPNSLFWKADLLTCFQGSKKKIYCEVWRFKSSPFWRNTDRGNCDTWKWPVKFRDFRETGTTAQLLKRWIALTAG